MAKKQTSYISALISAALGVVLLAYHLFFAEEQGYLFYIAMFLGLVAFIFIGIGDMSKSDKHTFFKDELSEDRKNEKDKDDY